MSMWGSLWGVIVGSVLLCTPLTGSSSSNLAGLGALALVAAVPAAGARFAGKLAAIICRMLGSCLNCTQSALNSLKLLLCCCFVASTLPSHRRRSSVLAPPVRLGWRERRSVREAEKGRDNWNRDVYLSGRDKQIFPFEWLFFFSVLTYIAMHS